MTRFARAGDSNKKKPSEASPWKELKKTSTHTKGTDNNKKSKSDINKLNHRTGTSTMILKKKTKTKVTMISSEGSKLSSTKITSETLEKKMSKNKLTTTTTTSLASSSSSSRETIGFDYGHVDQGIYQNSKSLIEELEEMDKQQLAEVNKLQSAKPPQNNEDGKMDLNQMDKKQQRSEERRLNRQKMKSNKMVCYHCREPGHGLADCPRALTDAEQGTGVCYRCGSTEHDATQCTARMDPNEGEFPFAKCFICQEMGHLSKSCPDNPRGLYPMGGGCEHCESVEHRAWDCPHNKTLKGTEEIQLSTYSSTSHQSADAEDFGAPRQRIITKKKLPKVVKF